jgi:hypothetical protein
VQVQRRAVARHDREVERERLHVARPVTGFTVNRTCSSLELGGCV